MLFCKKCGLQLEDDAVFCHKCGTPVPGTHERNSSQEKTPSANMEDDSRQTVMRDEMVYGVVDLNNLPEGHIVEERYEIKRKLGQGGFGAVYLAYDNIMKVEKALKILPDAISNDKEAMLRIQQESSIMIKLNHPNIVRVYDFHSKDNIKFIDMEYIDGESISELKLKQKGLRFPEEEVKGYAKQILDGLGYAHEQRVIHRDIKPQNIMLTKSGQIKLMDFGIAETLRNSVSRLENSTSSGTLVYMSPEQIRGKDVGMESDIYSLGATLYEMLSGNPPFYKGDINYQILNERPERIPHITDEMNEVLQKCLMKDREERYKTCNDMKDGIAGRFEERKIGQETQTEVKAKSTYSKQRRDTEVKEKSSNKSKISIITSVVIIILAIISYWYFQGNNSAIELAENNAINIDNMKDANWDKLSRLEQQRIEELIKQGDKQFISSKLVKPKGDNAYETYNEVLKLHKGNKYALAQLELIRKDFIRRAELEEKSKNLQAAVTILENGLSYYKNNNELKERAKKNKVEILLEKANTQYDANNLTRAEELTTEILAIETDNKRATELQDKIIERYKTEGEKANKSKNYRTALTYYEKINNIEPNSEEIAVKIKEIKDKIGQAELARKAEGKRIAEEQRQQEETKIRNKIKSLTNTAKSLIKNYKYKEASKYADEALAEFNRVKIIDNKPETINAVDSAIDSLKKGIKLILKAEDDNNTAENKVAEKVGGEWDVVFKTYFINNINNWFTGSTQNQTAFVRNNKYTISTSSGDEDRIYQVRIPHKLPVYFTIIVVMKAIKGNGDYYGITFNSNYPRYGFFIRGADSFSWNKWDDSNKWKDIIEKKESSSINDISSKNFLMAVQSKKDWMQDKIRLFINYKYLDRGEFHLGSQDVYLSIGGKSKVDVLAVVILKQLDN